MRVCAACILAPTRSALAPTRPGAAPELEGAATGPSETDDLA